MLRFALLRHDCPADYRDGPHWDLLLERPDTDEEHRLATWSLLALPTAWDESRDQTAAGDSEPLTATKLPDHRAIYLDYEGPVSGNRGTVSQIAGGPLEWIEFSETVYVAQLSHGSSSSGTVRLEPTSHDRWLLTVT